MNADVPLVEACRKCVQPNGSISGSAVAEILRLETHTLSSALAENSSLPAISDAEGGVLSHASVYRFVEGIGLSLHELGHGRGTRVAVILPNGPELALTLLSLMNWATCIPLNINSTLNELEADIVSSGATLILGLHGSLLVAEELNLPFVELVTQPDSVGTFEFLSLRPSSSSSEPIDATPNSHDDTVLMLFTSGTTGTKRIVPHTLQSVLTGAFLIASSWDLQSSDVCLNMMPLFHVGGILRQVVAPLVSGGSVICCDGFDPFLFWDLLQEQKFTWYYAAPTMHHVILSHKPSEKQFSLRMVANAAGGLSPSLAERLANSFQANVLPSYGSTECMPITSPPANYQLDKPGTSGVPVGPEVKILDPQSKADLPALSEGIICVRGAPCFRGYLGQDTAFLEGGWFDTGDLGYFDEDGYLFISGRMKEVINRGGEILSPLEIEEAVSQHPSVSACLAFAANHDVLQEVVGVVLVSETDRRVDITDIHDFLRDKLAQNKWPQCLVYMDELPKSHTNKLLRTKLASRLGLPVFSNDQVPRERLFHASCPPSGTPVDKLIPCEKVEVLAKDVESRLSLALLATSSEQQVLVVPHESQSGGLVCYVHQVDAKEAAKRAREILHGYEVPGHYVELKSPISSLRDLPPVAAVDSIERVTRSEDGSWEEYTQQTASSDSSAMESSVGPSKALNGVRFLVGCFVVMGHIGQHQNRGLLKLQAFSLSMQIFFFLASFQLSCKIKNNVLDSWPIFVGSKIGSLHALFLVTQFIALGAFLLFQCGSHGFQQVYNDETCSDGYLVIPLIVWALNTATGIVCSLVWDVTSSTTWFMGVLYTFILVFPWLHNRLRPWLSTTRRLFMAFAVAVVATIGLPGAIFNWIGLFELNYTIITWMPGLIAAMIAGYIFVWLHNGKGHEAKRFYRQPYFWGHATDAMSVLLITLVIAVILSPNCFYVERQTFETLRPGEDLPTDSVKSFGMKTIYWMCDVTYDEWSEKIQGFCTAEGGRWVTQVTKYFRFGRFGTPIVWVWLFGMSFGRGYTAGIMKSRVLQTLSPLAYPVYLLHLPIARYYWIAVKGLEAEPWWDCPGHVAVPVAWYHVLAIIAICLVLGKAIDRFLVPRIMPYTVQYGIFICNGLARACQCCCKRDPVVAVTIRDGNSIVFEQIAAMVRAGSGIEVSKVTSLSDTGLDSLGLTALLGNLRATVPAAKKNLTLQRLVQFQTIGQLVDFLDDDRDGDSV